MPSESARIFFLIKRIIDIRTAQKYSVEILHQIMNRNNHVLSFLFSDRIDCDYHAVTSVLYIDEPSSMFLVGNQSGEIIAWRNSRHYNNTFQPGFLMIPALNQSCGKLVAMCLVRLPLAAMLVST